MTTIKKQYQDIHALLLANKGKKVSTIMDELEVLMSAKSKTSIIHWEDEKVVAIYCYYHKQWELVSEVEYGKKASTKSGLNTMCKIGVSAWTKQQKSVKQVADDIMDEVIAGTIEIKDVKRVKDERLAKARAIDTSNTPNGYAELEDLIATRAPAKVKATAKAKATAK